MKYLVLIPDGAADYPVTQLGGKTPLEVARKPGMDYLARHGRGGLFETIPPGFTAGSAEANLSILGYDPRKYFRGRGVLEAAALGIKLGVKDVALRCNTLYLQDGRIGSHSAGHISSAESALLIESLNEKLGRQDIVFYPGITYRHILVLKESWSDQIFCFPPHDYVGQPIEELMVKPASPSGNATAELLNLLIKKSWPLLKEHPVNLKRIKEGQLPANSIWPWSPGRKPEMESFFSRFGIKGAVVAAVDLVKGLGVYCGFRVISVAGATGGYDTSYEAKAQACLNALNDHDLVYVHVEAPDEAGHEGNADLKVRCLEDFDRRLVQPVLAGIENKEIAVALLPDHFTPVSVRGHTPEPVPFVLFSPKIKPDGLLRFDENSCRSGSYGLLKGEQFIRTFLGQI
ncbi:MAG: cofactor-independent phosphoglycerate mutase [Candidatus Omnitrophica bacterium]|nr:cofactor-independent phosphoglycerate mutase [Candidatus Omnitrophota bacterium]